MVFLRYLIRPFEASPVLLIGIFTIILDILLGSIYGAIMSLLILSWYFKYAYVLLDATANGHAEPPVLSVEMLNPVDEQRPVAQLIICGSVGWLAFELGGTPGTLVALIGLFYLPASVAVLGTSSRAIDAVNPVALTRVIRGLGVYYAFVQGIVIAYAVMILFVLRSDLWLMLKIGFTLFCGLSIFTALGGALYERRHVLGFEATHSPERRAERAERERGKERHKALDEVYAEARGGNFIAARESLLRWLRFTDPDYLERDVLFIFAEARTWQDEKAFVFVSRFLISHLIETGKTGTAVEIVDGVLARAPTLKLGTAADTLKIATLARAAGKRTLALRVLAPFETQFPGDARLPEIVSMRTEMSRQAAPRGG